MNHLEFERLTCVLRGEARTPLSDTHADGHHTIGCVTPQISMPLARRSWVVETWGASPADVVGSWRGLSPSLRLTLEPVPVGYSGLPPV
jgi:hypothetical protein